MVIKIDIKSLIIGLLAGLFVFLALGASSGSNKGIYQLSMTAVGDGTSANTKYVVYGRINTGTGKIETWKYNLNSNKTVPYLRSNTKILLEPSTDPGN